MANFPMVNGQLYDFASVTFQIQGVILTTIRNIAYSDTQPKTNEYGAGKAPIGRGEGPIEYSASVTLLLEEVQALENASPTGRIQDIPPFDVIVSYLKGSKLKTDIIKYVEFTENGIDTSQGDTSIEVQLPMVPGGIWKNGVNPFPDSSL